MRKLQAYVYYGKSILTLMQRVKPITQVFSFLSTSRMANPKIFVFESKVAKFECHIRTPMEMWSFKETLLDEWYCKNGIEIHKEDTVVDIGCATGDFGLFAFAMNCAEYIGIDPVKRSLELAESNFYLNGISSNYTFLWAAAVGYIRDMYSLEDQSTVTSLHSPAIDTFLAREGIKLQTLTLEELVNHTQKKFINVLKLDCEGMEFEILLMSNPSVYDKIGSITMEVHLSSPGDERREALESLLKKVGYEVSYIESPVHKTLGYLYAYRA